ncbi:S49 family peptidase [bacterium]|nr:S49 family peptidase [bacterium]
MKNALLILVVLLAVTVAHAWEMESYSTTEGPAALLFNPALTSLSPGFEVFYNNEGKGTGGFLSSYSGTGLGLEFNGDEQIFWHYSTSFIRRNTAFGFSYHSDLSDISKEWWASAGTALLFKRFRLGASFEWGDRRDLMLSLGFHPLQKNISLLISLDAITDLKSDETDYLEKTYFHAGASLGICDKISLFSDFNYFEEEHWELWGGISITSGSSRSSASYLDENNYRISSASLSDDGTDKKYGRKDRIYRLDLKGSFSYFPSGSQGIFRFFGSTGATDFWALIKNIADQIDNDAAKGMYIKIGPNNLSLTQIHELRTVLGRFASASKDREIVVQLSSSTSLVEYYLASIATKIVMDKGASMFLSGFGGESLYFKSALKRFGIEGEFIRPDECTHKAAYEQFMRDDPSPEAKSNIEMVLGDFYNMIVDGIKASRNIDLDKLSEENFLFSAADALEKGMIDSTEFIKDPAEHFKNKLRLVSIRKKYIANWGVEDRKSLPVVLLSGIVKDQPGSGGLPFTNETSITPELWERLSKKIEAHPSDEILVLVDSPGGSGSASDLIFELTEALKKKGKRVYVYMLDIAGSGGYYIAINADRIYSSPFTLTGSIGVLGGKMNFAGLLKKLSIGKGTIAVGNNTDVFSSFTPFSDNEREKYKLYLTKFYDLFLKRITDSRDIKLEELRTLAGGRIYSGVQAEEIKLIDKTATLYGVIEELCKEKGYDEVKIERLNASSPPGLLSTDMQSFISFLGLPALTPLFIMEPLILKI